MQKALNTAKTITLPIPKDQLIITTDASRQAIGATMFNYLTISNSGLLVHRKSNPVHLTFETIAIPQNLLCGLINALHIKLNHPSKTQFKKVWHRYFFALDAGKLIGECTQFYHLCNSLKQIPNELFEQSTS